MLYIFKNLVRVIVLDNSKKICKLCSSVAPPNCIIPSMTTNLSGAGASAMLLLDIGAGWK